MKTAILCIVGILMILFAVGCDKRKIDVPTDPTQVSTKDASRVLAFSLDNDSKATGDDDEYYISLHNTNGDYTNAGEAVVEVAVGDSLLPLTFLNHSGMPIGWFSGTAVPIPESLPVTLKINNAVIMNSFVKPVNKISVAFSAHYNYTENLTVNWAFDNHNEYQFVKAISYSNSYIIDGGDNVYSTYEKQISANKTNYTFPANCVDMVNGNIEETAITLMVEEVNYKIVKKTAVMVYLVEGQSYNNSSKEKRISKPGQRILEIHKALSK